MSTTKKTRNKEEITRKFYQLLTVISCMMRDYKKNQYKMNVF